MSEELRIAVLGAPRATLAGEPVTGFISSKAQALLYYLAVTGRPHSRSSLATLLWGDMPESKARANLRVSLCNLRQLVPNHLYADREVLAFKQTAPYWLDTERFHSGLRLLNAPVTVKSEPIAREAIGLYVGEFLEGFQVDDAPDFEDWLLLEREHIRQDALQALHALTAYYTEQGACTLGIQCARQLLATDPWREEAHRQLMLLLALDQQRSAALAQYETCRRILITELGVEPLDETTELYELIRSGHLNRHAPQPQQLLPLPFVGREQEHAWLVQQWNAARGRTCSIALIEGELGIGKTRLAEEFLRYARSQQAIVLQARCYEFSNGVPYQPVVDLLRQAQTLALAIPNTLGDVWRREIARLLPEFDNHAGISDVPSSDMTRSRMFEATAQLLRTVAGTAQTQGQSLILFLDDLHWCDSLTLDLLRYLVYYIHHPNVWFLGAYQSERLNATHPLRVLRHSLGREDRLVTLSLENLGRMAIQHLIGTLMRVSDRQVLRLTSYMDRETGGNPFILSQVLLGLTTRGQLQRTDNGWEVRGIWLEQSPADLDTAHEIPSGIHDMVLERLERLGPADRWLLQITAVTPSPVNVNLIEALADRDAGVTRSLASCLESRLLISTHPGCYSFTLTMVRDVVYRSMLPAVRQELRNLVARTTQKLSYKDDRTGCSDAVNSRI